MQHEGFIERVARALARSDSDKIGPFICDDGRKVAAGKPGWTAWVEDARDAIEAMREPTEAMNERGYAAACQHDYGERMPNLEIASATWRAMIDAALLEAADARFTGPTTP